MTTIIDLLAGLLLLVVVMFAVIGASAFAAGLYRRRHPEPASAPAWLEAKLTRRMLVHTVEGQSIEGLLDTVSDDGLVLAAARFLDTDPPTDLLGETFIPRPRILFVQHVDRSE